jgi:hypothetical protein
LYGLNSQHQSLLASCAVNFERFTARRLSHIPGIVKLCESPGKAGGLLRGIYPTLYKTVAFTLFVGVFTLIENMVKGLWQGRGITGGLVDYFAKGPHELLAGSLVIFVAFIPFFAFKELGRVLGEEKIWALFFRTRDPGSASAEMRVKAV